LVRRFAAQLGFLLEDHVLGGHVLDTDGRPVLLQLLTLGVQVLLALSFLLLDPLALEIENFLVLNKALLLFHYLLLSILCNLLSHLLSL
jgi:hypothetical protein